MVVFHPDRHPLPMMHMGAEGANWIGLSRFVTTPHIFQNLGDGTYNHSGSLAIRAAVQARINITFKILFNDAVAMTGGQPVEGKLTVARIVQQVVAEGVKRVVVVAEDPRRFSAERLPAGTELRHRDALAGVQESLQREPGVSVLIYDQVCAAEKRRRRKIGTLPDPDRRIFINALACEGCGDCSTESNCLAIQPFETELGTKRRIDQSACNKDASCAKGFCPSFVTVEGARPRRAVRVESADSQMQPPVLPAFADRFDVLIAGIGGSGVVTLSAILAMAARIDGLGARLYDMTGLSQKGGAVFSHVRFDRLPGIVAAARIGPGQADVLIACDLVAAVHPECRNAISEATQILANTDVTATADFQVSGKPASEAGALIAILAESTRRKPRALCATRLAEKLFGDSIAANMLMLGYAWQLGCIPLTAAAIEGAIKLNGKAVATNLAAFTAGRQAASTEQPALVSETTLEEFIEARTADLVRYWNGKYAERYSTLLGELRRRVAALDRGDEFVWAVARSAYKLMAYKDEYEVARLYSDGRFRAALVQEFESIRAIKVHLAPPLISRTDPRTGMPRKMTFGPWILPLFATLARLKGLREGPFDVFARSPERRLERTLRDAYLRAVRQIAGTMSAHNAEHCIDIAKAPLEVRGYGHVKSAAAEALLNRLLHLDSTPPPKAQRSHL
jgi:indolepyruvate ferredoxin oxidoreductase